MTRRAPIEYRSQLSKRLRVLLYLVIVLTLLVVTVGKFLAYRLEVSNAHAEKNAEIQNTTNGH